MVKKGYKLVSAEKIKPFASFDKSFVQTSIIMRYTI